MNDLDKLQPMMPILPEIMGSVIPVLNPQIDWGSGLIRGFFHKTKVKQRAEIAQYEAQTSEAKTRNALAVMNMMFEMQTYGAKVTDFHQQMQHNKDMRDIEKNRGLMENQILFFQAKNEEMDYKIKTKAFEEQYGSE